MPEQQWKTGDVALRYKLMEDGTQAKESTQSAMLEEILTTVGPTKTGRSTDKLIDGLAEVINEVTDKRHRDPELAAVSDAKRDLLRTAVFDSGSKSGQVGIHSFSEVPSGAVATGSRSFSKIVLRCFQRGLRQMV